MELASGLRLDRKQGDRIVNSFIGQGFILHQKEAVWNIIAVTSG